MEIFHYGWVKPPESLQAKLESFHKLWHSEGWIEKNLSKTDSFDYSKIDSLDWFKGTHPVVMKERISGKNWHFNFDPTKKRLSLRKRILHFIEKKTGWRIGEYRNYKMVKWRNGGFEDLRL